MSFEEREQLEKQQAIFDRFTSLQHKSVFTIEGFVKGQWLDNGIVVQPDFITTAGLKELQEEFEHVAIDSDGLIIRD